MRISPKIEPTKKKRLIVVGAGFGGMAAIRELRGADLEITLIDRTNHYLFQPLLYQVATAALSPADIARATRALLRNQTNASVLLAEVVGVDVSRRQVRLAEGELLPYDYLILATGAEYSFFGHESWRHHTSVLKSLPDALSIREQLLGAFERAEQSRDPKEVQKLLTFVVVGAGPTGVELAGTIAEMTRSTLARDFAHIDPKSSRVVLIEMGPRVLSSFPESLSDYAKKALRSLGVEVRLGQAVEAIDADGLTVGQVRIESALILWCAGTKASAASGWIQAKTAKNGGIVVASDCTVPGHAEIFAIGDTAQFVTAAGKALPGLAPVAKQQGQFVARVIKAELQNQKRPRRFTYRDYGEMAIIGRSRAVARLGPVQFSGFLAWCTWSVVHLILLVDVRSQLFVYLKWLWAWLTYDRGARLMTGYGRDRRASDG